jgi:hypothetical protein
MLGGSDKQVAPIVIGVLVLLAAIGLAALGVGYNFHPCDSTGSHSLFHSVFFTLFFICCTETEPEGALKLSVWLVGTGWIIVSTNVLAGILWASAYWVDRETSQKNTKCACGIIAVSLVLQVCLFASPFRLLALDQKMITWIVCIVDLVLPGRICCF